jgi:hypothetical protein
MLAPNTRSWTDSSSFPCAQGAIAIRCRHATDDDKKFMVELGGDSKKHSLMTLDEMKAKAEAFQGGKGDIRSILSHNKKTEKHGEDAGQTKVRTPI